jgi:hypothetical protein
MTPTQFAIQQLRLQNSIKVQESIMVFIAALFVTALLPSLLIQYVYSQEELFTQPQLVMYIPVASFVIAVAYFLYAVVGNFRRSQQASQLEKQLVTNASGYNAGDHLSAAEMSELETMVDEALNTKPARKPRVATKTKRATKKTTKK